jgi:hypothetical protein
VDLELPVSVLTATSTPTIVLAVTNIPLLHVGCACCGRKVTYQPLDLTAAGQNVTIPATWQLLLDESPPLLAVLTINGTLRFDPAVPVTLTATYILVQGPAGLLQVGSPEAPHPVRATIALTGEWL